MGAAAVPVLGGESEHGEQCGNFVFFAASFFVCIGERGVGGAVGEAARSASPISPQKTVSLPAAAGW